MVEIEIVSIQEIENIFNSCEQNCQCKTCGRDIKGICEKFEGNCSEAQQLGRCPVAGCFGYERGAVDANKAD